MGGENDVYFFLSDRARPEVELCVQDGKLLDELGRKGVRPAQVILRRAKRKKNIRRALLLTPITAALTLIIGLPLFLSALPSSWLTSMISVEKERAFGEALIPILKSEMKIAEDHPLQPQIQKLVEQLQISSPELRALKLTVLVSASTDINAFALPGGIITVNAGLIQEAESTEEVMGVIAHELGHVHQRHSLRSMAGQAGLLAGMGVLGLFVGYDFAGFIAYGGKIATLKHSRLHELQADRDALRFLSNAGVSPKGLIAFFKRLERKHENLGGLEKAVAVFSTHPLSSERVERLEKGL